MEKKLETYEKGDYEGIMVVNNPVNKALFRWGNHGIEVGHP